MPQQPPPTGLRATAFRPRTQRLALAAPALAFAFLGCVGSGLPSGFAEAAATAPQDTPARLFLRGDAIDGAAAGIGPGGLPAPVRATIEAVTPGGETVFLGREWGPHGEAFRIEKRYVEGQGESFRSALVAEDGGVLERSHTLPTVKVPAVVLGAAMPFGRDIRRCEIVSDATTERFWRIRCVDGGGRTFVATVSLDGSLLDSRRLVALELQAEAR
jgi:hypothetical protein